MRAHAFAAAVALIPALCTAQVDPPSPPDLDRLPQVGTALPASARFGGFKLELEKTSLAQFRTAAHAGEIGHRGDAGESVHWLCYSLESSTNVWLSASELNGGERIDAVDIAPSGGRRCPVLPESLRPVTLQDGLAIGVPQERLLQKIGRPSAIRGGWWLYQHVSKIGAFDRVVTLGAHLAEGKVDRLFSAQQTTN